MIPIAFLQAWSVTAPWPDMRQVEQDLIISRALCDLFKAPALEGKPITRAIAEQRMLEKLTRSLTEDIAPLLPAGIRFEEANAIQAFERVWTELIANIGGEVWKLTEPVLEELRVRRFPGLLASRNQLRMTCPLQTGSMKS